jgi:hypothetical protein
MGFDFSERYVAGSNAYWNYCYWKEVEESLTTAEFDPDGPQGKYHDDDDDDERERNFECQQRTMSSSATARSSTSTRPETNDSDRAVGVPIRISLLTAS